MLNRMASLAIQQEFSKPCLVNLISSILYILADMYLTFVIDGMSASSDLQGKLIKFTSKVVAVEHTLFFYKMSRDM